ncbi:MAG: FtsW/RodA/SpoVE family cell cycle protein [Faecalibacterium sp.]|jgi:rod shape determining protein RodA|nr:FtsW/RodA/SpoVE family cell cycle protein [Faecalibacterium sp.]
MTKAIGNYMHRTDRLFWALCLGSSLFACVVLASIGMEQLGGFTTDELTGAVTGLGGYRKAMVQLGAMLAGAMLAVILSQIDYHSLVQIWPIHMAIAWGLVLPTLVLENWPNKNAPFVIGFSGGDTDNYSWYKIGGFTFQPTELAKISFILTFAMHLDHVRGRVNEPKELLKLLLHLLVPCAIIHIQGDDGTMLIFLAIGLCMLFAAGLSWKYILGALAVGTSAMAVAFGFFSDKIGKSYQWLRILAVYDPNNTSGWALNDEVLKSYTYQQSLGEISLGAGKIFGRGLFGGNYVYIPNAWNDFAFSWIGNAVGFVGCMLVLAVLLGIVAKAFMTGLRSEDMLGTFICTGIGGALLAQIIINIGMNVRVLPVVGVTLPFYSAGGSSMLMIYLSVGLVLSVYMHNKKTLFGNE